MSRENQLQRFSKPLKAQSANGTQRFRSQNGVFVGFRYHSLLEQAITEPYFPQKQDGTELLPLNRNNLDFHDFRVLIPATQPKEHDAE